MRPPQRSKVRLSAIGLLAVAWLALGVAGCGPAGSEESQRSDGPGADATESAEPAAESREVPAAEEMRMITVATGTEIAVELDQELSTRENEAGDRFTATVTQPVSRGPRVLIPSGSEVRGAVTAVQKPEESDKDAAVIKLDITEIAIRGTAHPIEASVVEVNPERVSETTTGEAAAKVGAGAAAGAILGRIIGGDATGTLIGAAVGAAAGTAIVLGTRDVKAVLPEGSLTTLRLDEPLRLPAQEVTAE